MDAENSLQLSMDGPNTNLKVLKDLKLMLKKADNDNVILDLGSCGIHTVHNSSKIEMVATQWKLAQFLRVLYNLIKNIPSWRAFFIVYAKSVTFPLKFCNVSWLENIIVAERALEMLLHLKTFINELEKTKI